MSENKSEADTHNLIIEKEPVPTKLTKLTDKIFGGPVKLMVILGSIIILAMILLQTSDVFGRYVLRRPIQGTDELIGFLFLCLAAFSFSYTQRKKSHIRIDLFTKRFSEKWRLGLDIITYLITLIVASLISWQLFKTAVRFINHLQAGSSVTEILGIAWYPFQIILGIGFFVLALVALTDTIASILKVRQK